MNKGVAFVSNIEEVGSQCVKEESLADDIALLDKKFNTTLKYLDRKKRTSVPYKRSNIFAQDKDKNKEQPISGMGTLCLIYGGYRHIRLEFPNYLIKQKKGLTITWSDYESEGERETTNNVMVYSRRFVSK